MLTAKLARSRTRDGAVYPLFIDPDEDRYRDTAEDLIQLFADHVGEPKDDLEATIDQLTITDTDYKVVQGLAKLLKDECEFETVAAADPLEIRQHLFEKANELYPIVRQPTLGEDTRKLEVYSAIADRLGISLEACYHGMYADLDANNLDVTAAHAGLDVLDWLDELGLEPHEIATFTEDIAAIAHGDVDLQRYGPAILNLRRIENQTSSSVEGGLGTLLEELADRDEDELARLHTITNKTGEFAGGSEQLEAAIDHAIGIADLGFSLSTAEQLATELTTIHTGDDAGAIEQLGRVYDEYGRLTAAVEDVRSRKERIQADIDSLEAEQSELETERDRLQESLARFDAAFETIEETHADLQATSAELQADIEQRRSRLHTIETKLQQHTEALESIQAERDVVHAYRRFLRDSELSDSLIVDLASLLDIHEGNALEATVAAEPQIRERTTTELRAVAMELFEGDAMMPVAEHERKLREQGTTEQSLAALEREHQAVLAFVEFLDTGELSETLLAELLDIKRGRGHALDITKRRKTSEVQDYLIEQLHRLTEGEKAIAYRRHTEILAELRQQHHDQLEGVVETIDQLARQLQALQTLVDDDWIETLSHTIIDSLDAPETHLTREDIRGAITETLTDEIDRRVELTREECRARASGAGVGAGASWDQFDTQ